jgi:hypothetical protein
MLISLHKHVLSGYPNADFEWRDIDNPRDFVTQRVWSACVWCGGTRGAVYFRCADLCVLDFDTTLTKDQAREALQGLRYFLAPTKSDGIGKVDSKGARKPPTDRFRVVIPFKQRIWDKDIFEYNMRLAIRRFNADPLPYDAGRVWQPSTRIESEADGAALDVVLSVPVEETQAYQAQQRQNFVQECAKRNRFPRRVMDFLDGNIHPSRRNEELFYVACWLFNTGWTVEKFRNTVHKIPAMDGHDKTESTIRSAAKRTGAMYF